MIIGRNILSALGIQFDFSTMSIQWEQASVPMKDSDTVADEVFNVKDPEAIQDASSRLKGILDAEYKKADLKDVAASAQLNCQQTKSITQHSKRVQ